MMNNSFDKLKDWIDNLYDEVCICDKNLRIIYINKACQRHYGLYPEELIGKSFDDLSGKKFWDKSIVKHVYEDKKTYAISQSSHLGVKLTTIATPLFDEFGEVEYIVMSVRDDLSSHAFYTLNEDSNSNNLSVLDTSSFIFCSEKMNNIIKFVHRIAEIDSTCLITGESGTGKTQLAKYIHSLSDRKDEVFLSINCASIPNDLVESELFGYAKGAFTGANSGGKKGAFEVCNKGTILLDEIGELPYQIQAKLLHVLQDKTFTPVGSNTPIKSDVRIIAATNQDLDLLVDVGKFRRDLLYRLNIFEVSIPPLRERQDDIKLLSYHFLNKYNNKYSKSHILSNDTLSHVINYHWPGNIRELSNTIERLVVTVDDIDIKPFNLPKSIFSIGSNSSIKSSSNEDLDSVTTDLIYECNNFDEAVSSLERKIILDAYNKYKTTRKVASALGISQTRATKLINKYIK